MLGTDSLDDLIGIDPVWEREVSKSLKRAGWNHTPMDEMASLAVDMLMEENYPSATYFRVSRMPSRSDQDGARSRVAIAQYPDSREIVHIADDPLFSEAVHGGIVYGREGIVAAITSDAEPFPHGFLRVRTDILGLPMVPEIDRSRVATVAEELRGWYNHALSLDKMTGLYSGAQFDRDFPLAVRDATESGDALSLLVMDGNGMKYVNDNLGYGNGDRWIGMIAQGLKKAFRRFEDRPYRVNVTGDEFTGLLPHTDTGQARHFFLSYLLQEVSAQANLLVDELERESGTSYPELRSIAQHPLEGGICSTLDVDRSAPGHVPRLMRECAEKRLHTMKERSPYSR